MNLLGVLIQRTLRAMKSLSVPWKTSVRNPIPSTEMTRNKKNKVPTKQEQTKQTQRKKRSFCLISPLSFFHLEIIVFYFAGVSYSCKTSSLNNGCDLWGELRVELEFSLSKLKPHRGINMTFDVIIVDTADGVDGPEVWTFSTPLDETVHHQYKWSNRETHNQDYPEPGSPATCGSTRPDYPGFSTHAEAVDHTYQLAISDPDHTDERWTVLFEAAGLTGGADESWRLDNVRVVMTATSCGNGGGGSGADNGSFFADLLGNPLLASIAAGATLLVIGLVALVVIVSSRRDKTYRGKLKTHGQSSKSKKGSAYTSSEKSKRKKSDAVDAADFAPIDVSDVVITDPKNAATFSQYAGSLADGGKMTKSERPSTGSRGSRGKKARKNSTGSGGRRPSKGSKASKTKKGNSVRRKNSTGSRARKNSGSRHGHKRKNSAAKLGGHARKPSTGSSGAMHDSVGARKATVDRKEGNSAAGSSRKGRKKSGSGRKKSSSGSGRKNSTRRAKSGGDKGSGERRVADAGDTGFYESGLLPLDNAEVVIDAAKDAKVRAFKAALMDLKEESKAAAAPPTSGPVEEKRLTLSSNLPGGSAGAAASAARAGSPARVGKSPSHSPARAGKSPSHSPTRAAAGGGGVTGSGGDVGNVIVSMDTFATGPSDPALPMGAFESDSD